MAELKEVRAEIAALTARLAVCSAVCSHERASRKDWVKLFAGAVLAVAAGAAAKKLGWA
jgi:hypothetical protein